MLIYLYNNNNEEDDDDNEDDDDDDDSGIGPIRKHQPIFQYNAFYFQQNMPNATYCSATGGRNNSGLLGKSLFRFPTEFTMSK